MVPSIYHNTRRKDPKKTIFRKQVPYRPGDKNQLKAQDVTAKLVRSDILRKVPKNILFCIKHT